MCVCSVGVVLCVIRYVEVCDSTFYVHMCTKHVKMVVVLVHVCACLHGCVNCVHVHVCVHGASKCN